MSGPSDATSNADSGTGAEPIEREDLVAYLDGELPPEVASRIEERLRSDEALRDELARLERAWDMLSTLPRTEAKPSLAKTTVEMLALELEDDVAIRSKTHHWRRWLGWGLAASTFFLAGLLGTVLAGALAPDPDAALLRDLPVVERLDSYHQARSIEFLRELRKRGLFVQDEERDRADAR